MQRDRGKTQAKVEELRICPTTHTGAETDSPRSLATNHLREKEAARVENVGVGWQRRAPYLIELTILNESAVSQAKTVQNVINNKDIVSRESNRASRGASAWITLRGDNARSCAALPWLHKWCSGSGTTSLRG
jgi:hypothetical protein